MENSGQRMNCYCWQTGENWVAVINPLYNEGLNQDSQAAFIQIIHTLFNITGFMAKPNYERYVTRGPVWQFVTRGRVELGPR